MSGESWRPPTSVVPGRALQLFRNGPAGRDPGHVGQLVRDPLVTVDAGSLAPDQELRMDSLRAWALPRKVHGRRGMTVAALEGIVRLQPRPLVLGKLKPVLLEFLPRVDRAEDVAPDFLGCLHLAGDLVGPRVRHVAVRAGRAYPRAVCEVYRALQLLVDVVMHFVTADAEGLGVGRLQRRVEAAPEDHAAEKAAEREEAEAEVAAGATEQTPGAAQESRYAHGLLALRRHDQIVHVDEGVLDQRLRVGLRHVALGAEIAARRHVRQ